jgi:hypothetical protein
MRKTWVSVLFVILAGLAAQGATAAYWINHTLLETDRFMSLITPVISSPEFAERVGGVVATKTVEALGVEEKVENALDQLNEYLQAIPEAIGVDPNGPIGQRLPALPDLTLLADPFTAKVESRVAELTTDLVSSSEFQNLADTSLRAAHTFAVAVVTGDESELPPAVTIDGDVELNFRPMIADAIVEVVSAGADALGVETPRVDSGASSEEILAEVFAARGIEVPDDFGRVVVLSEEQLEPYRDAVTILSRLQWVLILLTVLLSFAAIWTNPNRLVGTIWLGVSIVAFQLLSWPLTTTITESVIEGVKSSDAGLAEIVFQTATSELLNQTIVVIVLGVIVTLIGMVRVGMEGDDAAEAETEEEAISSRS